MDPDEALQELRELYNSIQDAADTEEVAGFGERFAEVFDGLDNWILAGGYLPKEWRTKR